MGLAELLVFLLAAIGPNGYLVQRQLAAPSGGPSLPTAALEAVAGRLWVVYHQRPDWAMAFYLPPRGGADRDQAAAEVEEMARVADQLPRLLPGLDLPRLFLYAPYYRCPDGTPVAVGEMSVDVGEYFFHALLEAWLDGEVRCGEGELGRIVAQGARERMRSVPSESRSQAYLAALADFGSEALSVGNELGRIIRRQRAAGKDPCRLPDHPATLFSRWGRIFGPAEYRGRYDLPAAEEGASGSWGISTEALEPSDKEIVVRWILGGAWSGDVRRDFPQLCPDL